MNESQQHFVFYRKPIKHNDKRYIFTVPADVGVYLHPDQKYEVSLRPVGTLVVVRT